MSLPQHRKSWRSSNERVDPDGKAYNIDGDLILVESIKDDWSRGREPVEICLDYRVTLNLLSKLGLPRRNYSRHKNRPQRDPTPEEIRERAAMIRRTWSQEIAAERLALEGERNDD